MRPARLAWSRAHVRLLRYAGLRAQGIPDPATEELIASICPTLRAVLLAEYLGKAPKPVRARELGLTRPEYFFALRIALEAYNSLLEPVVSNPQQAIPPSD